MMKKLLLLASALSFLMGQMFATNLDPSFFTKTNDLLTKHVKNGLVDYGSMKRSEKLAELITIIEKVDLSTISGDEKKAFLINAYNLIVIKSASDNYPLSSVEKISGFFDVQKHLVGGQNITLNKLEKEYLLKETGDSRLHFVLVCGAISCPVITNFAYLPNNLDKQMDMQTKMALNDPNFLKVDGKNVELSKIFDWYGSDFGGSKNSKIEFINKYRATKLPSDSNISYYEYDWTLNDISAKGGGSFNGGSGNSGIGTNTGAANASRYVVSAAIPKGQSELKLFNNLYSQRSGSSEDNITDRSTFFTTTLSALYGVTGRFNAGIETRYRRVSNSTLPSSPFAVLGSGENANSSRSGITAIGPKIRFAPIKKWRNFSVQTTLTFPVGSELAGSSTEPYIDWNGPSFYNQFFNDFAIGDQFSLFTEFDLIWEDIGSKSNNAANRISTPATLIGSFFPNPKTTLYVLGQVSPYYVQPFDYFLQTGVGAKYQFTSFFEVELLTTLFTNKALAEVGGGANTFSLGLRYNIL